MPKLQNSQQRDQPGEIDLQFPVVFDIKELSEKETTEISKQFARIKINYSNLMLPEKKGSVSPLLAKVPDVIDGAEKVRNFVNPPNPVLRIVHILDRHPAGLSETFKNELDKDKQKEPISPDRLKELQQKLAGENGDVLVIQNNIRKIILDLKAKGKINHIYIEGVTVEGAKGHVSELEDYRIRNKREGKNLLQEQKDKMLEGYTELFKSRNDIFDKDLKQKFDQHILMPRLKDLISLQVFLDRVQHPAANQSFVRREIEELRPTETRQVFNATINITKEGGKAVELAHEIREAVALQIIHDHEKKEGDGVAVVVFGGAHNLADNITIWNERNPKMQIALTEISPVGFGKELEKALKS